VTEHDRQVFFLIEELTECGMDFSLESVADHGGRVCSKRVIADGFAVIRRGGTDLGDNNFLAGDEAKVVIDHLRKTEDYVIMAEPWAPLGSEDDFDLIHRYAADVPEAVAEARRRHAERRAQFCP
jgi:hypothetical protein